ncbi:MAG: DUF465 domain-containing protein [Pseudomonadota bacterium]
MAFKHHYHALVSKHRGIEAAIASELKRPLPDGFVLQRLKRRKLLLKDQIEDWERMMRAMGIIPASAAQPGLS